jgi:hypothetical protein
VTDINGVPIIDVEATETPATTPKNATAIASVPITLAPGRAVFELKLREPGIVRGVAFWLHEPKVVASAMKGVQKIPMPLLLVECNPHGEVPPQNRVFAFIPSNSVFTPMEGWIAKFVATAMHEGGAMHLFELVEAPS